MSLGSQLKELRIKKGKSLQEVADEVKASKTHIWELERGTSKNPSIELISKLANYFSVTIDYLTGSASENDEFKAFARNLAEKDLSASDLMILESLAKELEKKNKNDN